MQYQVLVENQANGRFAAAVVGIPNCVAEAATQAEALRKAKTALEERLAHSQLFTIEVEGATTNPWLEIAGSLRDDVTFDDWQAEIAEYRRQEDDQPIEAATVKP
jgi:predicted RNase H-like HicB family nuclease